MLVGFQLRDVAAIEPWGREQPMLHWFGLSDGWYWINVGDVPLFIYHEAFMAQAEPWRSDPAANSAVDYYVVRLWEDLLDRLPSMLTPIPPELAARIADADGWQAWRERVGAWLDRYDDDDDDPGFDGAVDLIDLACGWWGDRRLPTSYLQHGPWIWCWRVRETVHLRWDNRGERESGIPVWAAPYGESTFPVATFLAEVRDFDARFIAAMGERVADVLDHWPRPDVAIDWERLVAEQPERAGWLAASLARYEAVKGGSWQGVLDAVAQLDHEIAARTP